MTQDKSSQISLKLKRCLLEQCEGCCCYDGAYLEPGEEEKIKNVVESHPGFFNFISKPYIVDGNWRDLVTGRKTAINPYEFRNPSFPTHFERTRCVFALPDARCSLQVLAELLGKHPWEYKPITCWLHPLRLNNKKLVPPPIDQTNDPDYLDHNYPGFITFTPCGRHQIDGYPWQEVLIEEIQYAQQCGLINDIAEPNNKI